MPPGRRTKRPPRRRRLDPLWLYVWVVATAIHLAALLHAAARAYAAAFGMGTHRTAVLPLVSMMVAVALFPPDQGRTLTWHAAAAPYALGAGFGLPLLLALLSTWRGRSGHRGR